MSNTEKELKALPCRGCNKTPDVEKGIVFCNDCHVHVHGDDSLSAYTGQAIERWNKLNTRPASPLAEENKRLREALSVTVDSEHPAETLVTHQDAIACAKAALADTVAQPPSAGKEGA